MKTDELNRRSRTCVFVQDALLTLLCLVWVVWAGKDLNWDLRNYHYYLPYSLVESRIKSDFFPASIQSYLNPVSYLPFYWMVKFGWPSILVSLVLAGFHSINLLLLWRISKSIFRSARQGCVALLVGALAPVFWVEVGTSFNDVIVSSFVLAGVHFAIQSVDGRVGSERAIGKAGLFWGAAFALKLTSAPYLLGALVFVFAPRFDIRANLGRFALLALGCGLGFALFGGYWSFQLLREFGNPVFPFFNQIFCSPDFPCENILASRFLPATPFDAAVLPFEIATPIAWVYTETTSPDIRFALIWVSLCGVGAACALSNRWRRKVRLRIAECNARAPVVTYFVVCWLLWTLTSANGRYGIPLALLSGIVLVEVINWLCGKYQGIAVGLIIALQGIQLGLASDSRWSFAEWRSSWFGVVVPPELASKPFLFLSVGQQSNSFLAPSLHSESAFANVVGQTSLSTASFGGTRLQKMLIKYAGRTRMLATVDHKVLADGRPSEQYVREVDILLSNLETRKGFGLKIDPDQCLKISAQAPAAHARAIEGGSSSVDAYSYVVISCALIEKPRVLDDLGAHDLASQTMNSVEKACPNLFNPRGAVTERTINGYRRYFVGTEVALQISHAGHVYLTKTRVPNDYDLGRVSDWRGGKPASLTCPKLRRSPPWFSVSQFADEF